jgi:hypothetical protein
MAFVGTRDNGPTCGCCADPCPIFVAASFVDLTGLTQIGTVTVSGGAAVLQTGEGLITNSGPTNATDPVHLEFVASTTDDPATIRAMVAADDEDDGLAVEYTLDAGVGTLRVGDITGGSATWLTAIEVEDTADLGDSTTYMLCWVPGEVQAGDSYEVTCDAVTKTSFGSWDDPPTLYSFSFSETAPPVTYEFFPCLYGIPPGSTIDGIAVQIECSLDMPNDVQLTEVALLAEGLEVGSQNPNTTVSGTPIGDSGTLSDWGAVGEITWANIYSLAVGFTFTAGATAGGAQLTIADATVQVDYTTPDRQPGRLTFSRNNVTVATIDCARNYQAQAPTTTGKKAVVLSVDGEWPVSALSYKYHLSETKPTCPECECTTPTFPCEYCCTTPAALAEYVLDLGAGGWTDGGTFNCTGCNEVAGEYLLEPFSGGLCMWRYAVAQGTCGDVPQAASFGILLYLLPISETECQWMAVLKLEAIAIGSSSGGAAIYESALFDKGTECQTLPVTLNKIYEVTNGCGGSLPSTISLEAP